MIRIILLFLFFLNCNIALTQEEEIIIGFHLSPMPTWLSSSDREVEPDGGSFAFKFGIRGEKILSKNLSLGAEVNFGFGLGGQLKHKFGGNLLPKSDLTRELKNIRNDFSDGTTIDYNFIVAEMPVYLKITSNSKKKISFFGHFPILGLALITHSKANIETQNQLFEKENIGKDIKNLMLTWGLSGGVECKLNDTNSLLISLGYQQSFTDITRNKGTKNISPTESEKENASIRLNQLVFRVGYIF